MLISRFVWARLLHAGAIVGFATCFIVQSVDGEAQPKTETLSPAATANRLTQLQGSFGGIGAKLLKTNVLLQIENVVGGGPADRAGLKSGETITAINGVPIANLALEDAVKMMRGTVGSAVELTMADPGTPTRRRIRIVREAIDVSGVKSDIIGPNIGWLALTTFTVQTPGKVLDALEQFTAKAVRGIVLDVRNDGGGLYPEACEVASFFIGAGRPLWLIQAVGELKAQPVPGKTDQMWPGPLVVLTSTNTGSAAELLVAALQSNGRAKVIGQTTAGTACLQSLEKQPDDTTKKVLRANFFTLKNERIYGRGIPPDISVKAGVPPEQVLEQGIQALPQKQ
jgi:carboxyl-terminal processing protease